MRFKLGWELEYQNSKYSDSESLSLPRSCIWCHDSSVSGGEIKLAKPSSLKGATIALEALLVRYSLKELEIDTGCSFHVHLSEANMIKEYNQDMQVAMIQYLYDHMDDVPTCVLNRWISENRCAKEQYFHLDCTSSKYNFIAYRDMYDTWEFRCFGNICSADCGIICMKLAIEAYKWACKHKSTDKVLPFIPFTKKADDVYNQKMRRAV